MSADSPWKPCDLRGVFPSAISEDLFTRVGRAMGSEIAPGARVVVGGDFRLSTPALKAALIQGLAGTGLYVIDLGQAPTPIAYFLASRIGAAAVFIVTASHNPAAHNGLKWMVGEAPPTPEDMERIRNAAESGVFRSMDGGVETFDPIPEYREWIVSQWKELPAQQTGRIVLDAGNGAWSQFGPEVFAALGFETLGLGCWPDGSFPNRPPDCARTANLGALRAAVVEQKAALGIAWDGDGDRVAFVDESGVHASTDEISILLARHLLGGTVPENVVCDIKLSDSVRREVLRAGATPLLERSGHAFMRSRLLSSQAILGLDACGHYFFRQAGSRDDGLYSALFLIGMLNGERTLGALRRGLEPMFSTPELRMPATLLDFATVRDRLRSAFPYAEESAIDGARLVLDDGVVLARESSTERVVSLRIEGFSSESYGKLVNSCLGSLHEANSLLRGQIAEAD
jgi:phosphomannomutase